MLSSHRHTGKRLHRRHTSHAGLFLVLLLVGAMLLFSFNTYSVTGLSKTESQRVTAVVAGPAPTAGAVITNPLENSRTYDETIPVSGTCPNDTYIVVYVNGAPSGSSLCHNGAFAVTIQLSIGTNTIQAQNYSLSNQAGPATQGRTVIRETLPNENVAPAQPGVRPDPTIPLTITPPLLACTSILQTKELHLSAPCIITAGIVGEVLSFDYDVYGGQPPYAVSIDWGDGSNQPFNIGQPGRQSASHTYNQPGAQTVTIKVVDRQGTRYQLQTVVIINGQATSAPTSPSNNPWLNATIPVYFGVAALVIGFWFGDIFERLTSVQQIKKRTKSA